MQNLHAQRKAQASGPQLQQVDQDFARVFRINASELERVFEITHAANSEIKAIENQIRDHANERARLELFPDKATMQALEERRKNAIQTNLNRLRTSLSAANWTAISNFINTELRNSTTFAQPKGKQP